jgi:hypothetical protein
MSLKKTVAIAAAAGALAAVSMPAMAFENEFHGLFNAKFYLTNIDAGSAAQYNPTTFNDSKKTSNFFEQRARLQYTAKASDDLKLVTQFELDSNFGGVMTGTNYRGITTAGTQSGQNSGALDADSITLETKHVYLDFNAGPTKVKLGIQPFADAFNGTFLIADIAGLNTSSKLGPLTLGAGYYRVATLPYVTSATSRVNDMNTDIFALDLKYAISKDLSVGVPYYFYADYTKDAAVLLHTLGLNVDGKMGPLSFNAFAATQMGHEKLSNLVTPTTSAQYHGMAMGYNVKMAIGPGTLKTGLQYTSGDNSNAAGAFTTQGASRTGWRSIYGSANNQSGLMLLSRNDATGGLTNTHFLVFDSGFSGVASGTASANANQFAKGMTLFNLGYDAALSKKAYANANVGMAWVAKSGGAPTDAKMAARNASDLLGTELNVETGYKLYDNLTVKLQAAYVILGGYYKGAAANSTAAAAKDPENPYTFRTGLSYTF